MLKKLFIVFFVMPLFSLVYASSNNYTLTKECASLAQSICNDDYETFKQRSNGILFDDRQFYGTMLLNLAAAAPRDKRKNTQRFIKDLIRMKAAPNKAYQVLVKKVEELKETANGFQMSGSTGYKMMHLPLEYAILEGNVAAVEALCQLGADVRQSSIKLTSWWHRWFVESEKPSSHAEVYLYANGNQKAAMGCMAKEGELFEILKILEGYEKEAPAWEDWICPIQ